jgi:hypothetical protein
LIITRIIALCKRQLLSAINIKPNSWNTARREERPLINLKIDYGLYSKGETIEMVDPRSNTIIGNYFQPRSKFEVNNVIIEPTQGLVFVKNSKVELLRECTRWPVHWVNSSFPITPHKWAVYRKTIKKGILLTANPFYHWLVEDLPGTISAMETFPQEIPLIVIKKPPNYVEDFLKTTTRSVIRTSNFANVHKLYIVDKGSSSGWPQPTDLKILNNYEPFKSAKKRTQRDEYIYISRLKSSRSPSNENEIQLLFEKNGFTVYYLENYDLLQQISIISSARVIAGIHGAGLTNLIWMEKNCTVLDIVNENYWTEAYFKASFISGVKYESYVYEGTYSSKLNLQELNKKIQKIILE